MTLAREPAPWPHHTTFSLRQQFQGANGFLRVEGRVIFGALAPLHPSHTRSLLPSFCASSTSPTLLPLFQPATLTFTISDFPISGPTFFTYRRRIHQNFFLFVDDHRHSFRVFVLIANLPSLGASEAAARRHTLRRSSPTPAIPPINIDSRSWTLCAQTADQVREEAATTLSGDTG